ncbi:MAG: hypothetical protein MMC23_005154 [Stictis urceolatum]|nr:hypothetical protein [Stictis urceolata]
MVVHFEFMQKRTGATGRWLRKIHLDIQFHKHDGQYNESPDDGEWDDDTSSQRSERAQNLQKDWHTAISPDIVRQFRLLDTLHLTIAAEECYSGCRECARLGIYAGEESWENNDKYIDGSGRSCREHRLHFLTKFQALNKLQRLTVSAHAFDETRARHHAIRLPITARWLRDTIPDPRGQSKYSVEVKRKLVHGQVLDKARSQLSRTEKRFLIATISWLKGEYESEDSRPWDDVEDVGEWSDDDVPGSPDPPNDKHADLRSR